MREFEPRSPCRKQERRRNQPRTRRLHSSRLDASLATKLTGPSAFPPAPPLSPDVPLIEKLRPKPTLPFLLGELVLSLLPPSSSLPPPDPSSSSSQTGVARSVGSETLSGGRLYGARRKARRMRGGSRRRRWGLKAARKKEGEGGELERRRSTRERRWERT